jgi:hypothetical protein
MSGTTRGEDLPLLPYLAPAARCPRAAIRPVRRGAAVYEDEPRRGAAASAAAMAA